MNKEEMLEILYNAVKEELKPSEEEKKEEKRFAEVRDKFLKEIGEEYREKLEKVTDAAINVCTIQEKQFFYEGYKTAETLLINN